jgi:hypothetical protein
LFRRWHSNLLVPAHTLRPDVPQYCVQAQDHELDAILDLSLIEQAAPAIQCQKRAVR